ncbi:MAG: hypothetical protein QOI86_694, partial [Actinomycetota bacterium]|nr:hypothetical protein [Actinomycetota bacterium]
MEISEKELRGMVADIDDQHRAAMCTFTEDSKALIFETGPSRRRFLAGLGLGSAALVVGSAMMPMGKLVPKAWAEGTPSDGDIATFAASVEFAAVAAYMAAAKSGLVKTKAVLDAATAFAGQHQQHGEAFKAAGTNPNVAANKGVLDMVTPQLTAAKTENDVVALAYGLENAAAATYIFALGVLGNEKAYNAV